MALIECPECKQKVSSEAKSCPHCGYPLKQIVVDEKPKTEEIRESFTVGYRSGPGGIVGAVVVVLLFGLLAIIGGIFALIYSLGESFITFLGVFCIPVGVAFIILAFVDISYFVANGNHMDKNCIEYDAEKDKLVLCTIYGEIIEINVEDYISLKDNMFTDNMLYFTYKTNSGTARKVKLGYCSNRDDLRRNIASIRK